VIDSNIYNEGIVAIPNPTPFQIPFESIIADSEYATNFLNPVTVSASHVALGAIRLEPTYMIMGQSAATAAVLALEGCVAIQDVDLAALNSRLKADAQVLSM